MPVLSAAASAADWNSPRRRRELGAGRPPRGARATLPAPRADAPSPTPHQPRETVSLIYRMPGMSLSMRARALEDGAVGHLSVSSTLGQPSYRRGRHRSGNSASQSMSKQNLLRTLALVALAAGGAGCASVDTADLSRDALAAPGVGLWRGAARAIGPPQLNHGDQPLILTAASSTRSRSLNPPPTKPARQCHCGAPARAASSRPARLPHRRHNIPVDIEIDDSADSQLLQPATGGHRRPPASGNFFGLEEAVGRSSTTSFDPAT